MDASSDDRGPNIVILYSVFTSISVLITGFRLCIRKAHHQLGWDDLTIFLAIAFTILAWPFTILAVKSGYGKHITLLSTQQSRSALKYLWIVEFCLFFTLPLTKASICYFILRIKNTGWLKCFLYTIIIGLFLTSLPAVIVLCAQCQPFYAYWDREAGTCWDPSVYVTVNWISVAFNIFSDLTCTCLPIIVLWNVRIKRRMKYLISALMGLGLLATACGGVRAYVSAMDYSRSDLTYSLAINTEWAALEQHLAILGNNLTLSRYLWLAIRPPKTKDGDHSGPCISLSQRRRGYTTINGSAPRKLPSLESTVPLEPGAIRATTDIDVQQAFPSQPSDKFVATPVEWNK